tara:strand:- start:181 stop:582 length:402 start_codon:yes stop_codon:yes gene_type:complete
MEPPDKKRRLNPSSREESPRSHSQSISTTTNQTVYLSSDESSQDKSLPPTSLPESQSDLDEEGCKAGMEPASDDKDCTIISSPSTSASGTSRRAALLLGKPVETQRQVYTFDRLVPTMFISTIHGCVINAAQM